MGKRELLIIAAFAVLGLVAYRATASPAQAGARKFSLASLLESWRRSGRGNMATASVTTEGRIVASRSLREVRLSASVRVTVIGEERSDIAYVLTVEGAGPDEATARARAAEITLKQDDLGELLGLALASPPPNRPAGLLTVRVPGRLSVRLDGSRRTEVSNVAAVYLDNLSGETLISRVSGGIAGAQRSGSLTVSEVGSVTLTLAGTKSVFRQVRGATTLNARNGETRVEASRGPIEIEHTSQNLTLVEPESTVRVSGSGGDISVERPQSDLKIDVRRSNVTITLDTPISATVLTTERPIHLFMVGDVPITVDAVTTGGPIEAPDFHVSSTTSGEETQLLHRLGDQGRIALRNQRGAIEIAKRK